MNKTKRELYEENKKYKKTIASYSDFWETDALEEYKKQFKITKYSLIVSGIILLIISAFLLGLSL